MPLYRVTLSLLVVALAAIKMHADDKERADIAKALDTYYKERLARTGLRIADVPPPKESTPPWGAALRDLSSGKPAAARQGAAYLCELLAVVLEHEGSASPPWRKFSGDPQVLPTVAVRVAIAEELARIDKPPVEILPVLRWYFANDPASPALPRILTALRGVPYKDAAELWVELAMKPHENVRVAATALTRLKAETELPSGRLEELCQHHREAIREAAAAQFKDRTGKKPAPFDPDKAMQSAPFRALMRSLTALLPELPDAKLRYGTVTVRELDASGQGVNFYDFEGWWAQPDDKSVTVYTLQNEAFAFRQGAQGAGQAVDFSFKETKVVPLVRDAVRARKDGPDSDKRSKQPGYVRRTGAAMLLYEATLAAGLVRAGQEAFAAEVLLPALDTLPSDRAFLAIVAGELGEREGKRMLVAFAGDRDYDAALKCARRIADLYPTCIYARQARGLLAQLPGRAEDFKTVTLPTPADWARLQKKLGRAEQIEFLCTRVRLINVFQATTTGASDLNEPQYAEACGMLPDATVGLHRGKTEVINPLVELRSPRPGAVRLTLKDVPLLSAYLRGEQYMPVVSFRPEFLPGRGVMTTRYPFAALINELAGRDLCRIDCWAGLNAREIDTEIERINRWAKDNADRTGPQREAEALAEIVKNGADWTDVAGKVEALLRQKEPAAFDLMKRFLADRGTDSYHKKHILDLYRRHDLTRATAVAPTFLKGQDATLRYAAALILFQSEDAGVRSDARRALGEALEGPNVEECAEGAEMLLKDATANSKKEFLRVFANRRLMAADAHWGRVMRLAAATGMKEPYQFYLGRLKNEDEALPLYDDKDAVKGRRLFVPTVQEAFAKEVVDNFAPTEPAVKAIVKKYPDTADQVPRLKKWLQERIDEK